MSYRKGQFDNDGYYDTSICSKCKGKDCCAHFGCMYSPNDFIVLRNDSYSHEQRLLILTELLKRGKISIDMSWEKDTKYGPLNPDTEEPDFTKISNGDGLLYLRARNKGQPVIDLQYFLNEQHYPCAQWDPEKGCTLSREERPFIGRMLQPVAIELIDGIYYNCVSHGEVETVKLWSKHQKLMFDLYCEVKKLNIV